MVVAFNGPVDSLPLNGLVPLQPPEAVQLVALAPDQSNVALPPTAMTFGEPLNVTNGGGGPAVTLTVELAVPPAPVQVKVNAVVAANGGEASLPLVGLLPDQPPLAVQLVALVEVQLRFVDWFVTTDVGSAVRLTVGAGGAVTVTDALALPEPPAPEQVSVNVVLAFRAAVVSDPLVALFPVQPPEAVQDVALVLLQLSEVVAPVNTLAGAAVRDTVAAGVGGGLLPPPPPPPPQAAMARQRRAGAVRRIGFSMLGPCFRLAIGCRQ